MHQQSRSITAFDQTPLPIHKHYHTYVAFGLPQHRITFWLNTLLTSPPYSAQKLSITSYTLHITYSHILCPDTQHRCMHSSHHFTQTFWLDTHNSLITPYILQHILIFHRILISHLSFQHYYYCTSPIDSLTQLLSIEHFSGPSIFTLFVDGELVSSSVMLLLDVSNSEFSLLHWLHQPVLTPLIGTRGTSV